MSDEEPSPEIIYVPGAENHYKYEHNVIVLDSQLREYPDAHDLIKSHELAHAECDSVFDHLRLELKTDIRHYFSTDRDLVEVRRYLQERDSEIEYSRSQRLGRALVNDLRYLWILPMILLGAIYRRLRGDQT